MSPNVKTSKPWLFWILFIILIFWVLSPSNRVEIQADSSRLTALQAHRQPHGIIRTNTNRHWTPHLELQSPVIPSHSLTAILPVTLNSIETLEETLASMAGPSKSLREIILVCPESVVSQAYTAIRRVAFSGPGSPVFELYTLVDGADYRSGVLNAASRISTEWVLFLDHHGLIQETNNTRHFLINPPGASLPIGPRGVYVSADNVSCVISDSPEAASYLYPPFVMPTPLVFKDLLLAPGSIWENLGQSISESRADGLGGIVVSGGANATDWCSIINRTPHVSLRLSQLESIEFLDETVSNIDGSTQGNTSGFGVFGILLPTLNDFRLLNPLACLLQDAGHRVETFIYNERGMPGGVMGYEDRGFTSQHCTLAYTVHSRGLPRPTLAIDWLRMIDARPDVLIYPREEDGFTAYISSIRRGKLLGSTVFVHLSREDFPHSVWMGTLSMIEWRSMWLSCINRWYSP